MMRIGMTGGIACGKSLAAKYFSQEHGVPVIDADDIGRALTAPGSSILNAIAQRAGADILQADGSLDRALLRARIFREDDLRRDIEALLHPPTRAAIRDWLEQQDASYVIAVVPLLIEAKWQDDFDRILVVHCPESLQRERLQRLGSPKIDNRQIDAILAAQLPADERQNHADDVIENVGDRETLAKAVAALHQKYLAE